MNLSWFKDTYHRQRNLIKGYSSSPIEMESISTEYTGHSPQTQDPKVEYITRSTSHISLEEPVAIGKIDPKRGWTPVWLRRFTLAGFAALFLAMFVALQVLYSISQRNHGLATSKDQDHYLWTYGPTAGIYTSNLY